MSAYENTDEIEERQALQRTTRGSAPVGLSSYGAKPTSIFQTTPFQVILSAFLLLLLIITISACVLLSVFHFHLLFLCGYAEFLAMVVLQGVVLIFVGYNGYHIYKFFVPSKEDEDEYGGVGDEDEDDEDDEVQQSKLMKVAIFAVKIIGTVISLFCAAMLVAICVTAITYQQLSLPPTSGQLHFAGLKDKVQIQREPSGVIHIIAENDHDMFFAQGVVVAQERMWQLEFYRRIGTGTFAEIVGPQGVEIDKFSRTMGIYRAANETLASAEPDTIATIEAFTSGINAYLALDKHVAPEFHLLGTKPQLWKPVDVCAFFKLIAWDLAVNSEMEAIRLKLLQTGLTIDRINVLYPFYPKDAPTVLNDQELHLNLTEQEKEQIEQRLQNDNGAYKPAPTEIKGSITDEVLALRRLLPFGLTQQASNNWVLSGKLTNSGKPILSNDPHLRFSAPGLWYLVHLQSKESGYNAIGAAFPGTPGIILGQNEHISWGATNSMVDSQDLYVMDDVGTGPNQTATHYIYKGEQLEYLVRKEVIKVKGADDVFVDVRESIYGPVVNEHYNFVNLPSVCLRMIALHSPDKTADAFGKLPRARNWDEFSDALNYVDSTILNMIYADHQGNIGYILRGLIPIRKEGHSGRYPVPGNGDWDYVDFIPKDQLPRVFNPDKGYFASANNRITPRGYQYAITNDWESQYRIQRIVQLIEEKTQYSNATVDDMIAIQMDSKSLLFDDFAFVFSQIKSNVSEDAQEWAEKLAKWDGFMTEGSDIAPIFETWLSLFAEVTKVETGDKIWKRYPGFLKYAVHNIDDAACQSRNMTCLKFAANALNAAVQYIEENFGGTAPVWGIDVHDIIFQHQLLQSSVLKCVASKSIFGIGGTDTVNYAGVKFPDLTTSMGVSYRQVVDLSKNATDAEGADKFIIPLGQSGNWLSKSYDPYIWMWKTGQYLDMKLSGFEISTTLELSN